MTTEPQKSLDYSIGVLEGMAMSVDTGTAWAEARNVRAMLAESTKALADKIATLEAALAAKPSDEDLTILARYLRGGVQFEVGDYSAHAAAETRLMERYAPRPSADEPEPTTDTDIDPEPMV